MAHRDFFSDEAKARAKEAVALVEKETAAEIVVTVRRASSRYRDAMAIAGGIFGLAVLAVLLFHPQPFDVRFMPIDVVLGGLTGAAITSQSDVLRRLLTSPGARSTLVDVAAKAAFVDLGVSKTRARTGLLVYVSMLEKNVVLVGDLALERIDLKGARATLESAVGARDFEAFVRGLVALGPLLAKDLPCPDDDVNELPDEVTHDA